jgi:hypothetical protein
MAVFDNGNLRVLDKNGTECGSPGGPACYSRAIVLQIDEGSKIASILWQYTPGPYSIWGGSINQLANGNVEFDMSAPFPELKSSRVLEVSQADTPQIVWQMDIQEGHAYRAYRMPSLYPGVSWK